MQNDPHSAKFLQKRTMIVPDEGRESCPIVVQTTRWPVVDLAVADRDSGTARDTVSSDCQGSLCPI